MAADRADEENLKAMGLGVGEWGDMPHMPIPLAMDYGMVAETLGHGIALAGTASDVWKNAAGLALQRVMRRRNHGLGRLPVLPASAPGALSALLNYMFPPDAGPASAGATVPPPSAVATAPAGGHVAFDAASLAALRELASSNAVATSKPDPIVLGHSKVEDGGTAELCAGPGSSRLVTLPLSKSTKDGSSLWPVCRKATTSPSRLLCTSCRCRRAICWPYR